MPKKAFLRRLQVDRSQALRRSVQYAFVALNVWIGIEFFLFVRQLERGLAVSYSRPAGVEGWLPIAGLLNLKYFLVTGTMPRIHPAAMVLLAVFLVISWLLRRSFCSWICPIGTLSEWLWKLGRSTFRRNWALPRWLDITLRPLKYLLLGFFVFIGAGMSADAIDGFMHSPYGVVADVKMLDFFRNLSLTSGVVLAVLVVASVFVQNFWCRYLCPYGALTGIAALLSPLGIRRSTVSCIDCGKCTRACPSQLPVDRLVQIRSAECTACLECVASCPVEQALTLDAPTRVVKPEWLAAAICGIFLIAVIAAKLTGHWDGEIPLKVYEQWVPMARDFSH
jgi:polyferredoxin